LVGLDSISELHDFAKLCGLEKFIFKNYLCLYKKEDGFLSAFLNCNSAIWFTYPIGVFTSFFSNYYSFFLKSFVGTVSVTVFLIKFIF
jgi:hypothetical protein